MALELEPTNLFPDADIIARLYHFDGLTVEPLREHHGAQAILRPANGPEWVLKHCRVEGMTRLKLEAILAALDAAGARLDPSFIPALRQMTDGARVLAHEDRLYYVMMRVEGRRPSFRREADVVPVLAALGRLHALSADIALDLSRALGEPIEQSVESVWRAQMDYFGWLNSKLSRRTDALTPAGRIFADRHGAFRDLAAEADAWLKSQLGDLSAAKCPLVLAHGDSYENNYMLAGNSDSMPWLLDLESVGLRPGSTDLVVPLATFGITHRWSPKRLRRLLGIYEQASPLPEVERALLRAMLIFPRQWTRSMHCLVRRRKQQRVDWGTLRNLTNCMLVLPAHRRFLNEIKNGW